MKLDSKKAQKKLGEVIRAQRKDRGFSQEEFAFECGVHRTYMGAIERGERNLSLKNLIKISNQLSLKPSQLFEMAML